MGIEEIFGLAVRFRRYFHQWPEVSMEEFKTQSYITGILKENGVVYNTYGTGIIAKIGNGKPCVAIRCDMDGLRVEENTGLPYESENAGKMHACGHDMHMGMVLAVALVLKEKENDLKGTVKIVFQPSEEKRPGGARLLLPELMKGTVPDAIFAQHIYPGLPSGEIGVRSGAFFASSDNIVFSVEGKGTHAAMPQNGADPILATACLVQFYQTLVTKFRDPLLPAVLSITAIHGGSANNVIPDRVDVMGTVRTHDNGLREDIFKLIDEKSELICGLYGCVFHRDKAMNGLPVLVNDKELTEQVVRCAKSCLNERVVHVMEPLTLGEDFAIYLQHIPGVMWLLGVCPEGQIEMAPLHSPAMAPDENAMKAGCIMLLENIREFFERYG